MVIATLMFSFVGTLVKISQRMVGPSSVTFSRFFFGILFLVLVLIILKRKPRFCFSNKWIWIAVAAKCLNYFAENYALSRGYSYGNIVVYPVQAVAFYMFSVFFFKEKINAQKVMSMLLCISGIMIISWNGNSLSGFFGDSMPITLLFVLAAFGGATFVLSQKMMIKTMASIDMNISVFLAASLISSVPMSFDAAKITEFNPWSLFALMGLGIITGGAFLLNAKALETISLFVNGIIQSSSVIFTILWGLLFFREKLTVYLAAGTVVFLCGIVLINIPQKQKTVSAES